MSSERLLCSWPIGSISGLVNVLLEGSAGLSNDLAVNWTRSLQSVAVCCSTVSAGFSMKPQVSQQFRLLQLRSSLGALQGRKKSQKCAVPYNNPIRAATVKQISQSIAKYQVNTRFRLLQLTATDCNRLQQIP